MPFLPTAVTHHPARPLRLSVINVVNLDITLAIVPTKPNITTNLKTSHRSKEIVRHMVGKQQLQRIPSLKRKLSMDVTSTGAPNVVVGPPLMVLPLTPVNALQNQRLNLLQINHPQ